MSPIPAQSKGQQLFGAVLFFAGALFSLWVVISSVVDIIEASNAVAWPTAEGIVISSKAEKGCGRGASFFPSVQYKYTVGEQQYFGRRIAFGNCGCGSEGSAAVVANEYPEGKSVAVHFNPTLPNEAVLVVGRVLGETWLGVFLMSFMFVASSALAYVLFKQARSNISLQGTLRDKAAQRP